ncbi:hypothetical protein [Desertimonas flava]|uniref:hypothetical protein n=1 Tax=Desertimonas flava TaxID=2064846 RepID=UPI000E352267|nr:hypothetical protein [Desertimonas flava]
MTAIEGPDTTERVWSARRVGPLTIEWRGQRTLAGWSDDVVTVGIGAIGAAAMYWDSWRHNGKAIASDGFWSPPHILLYVALGAVGYWIGLIVLRRQQPGFKALNLAAIPRGYGIGMVGLALAGVGGIGDYIWHAIFGFEDQVNAFWSPPHQLLFLGGTLVVTAPLVSSWYRHDGPLDARSAVPVVGSLALIMSTATYALTHLSPLWNNLAPTPAFQQQLTRFDDAYPAGDLGPGHVGLDVAVRNLGDSSFPYYFHTLNHSVASFLLLSITLVAPVLFLVRRWSPPPGAVAVIFGLYGLVASIPTEFRDIELVAGLVVAGAVIDVLIARLQPALPSRPWQFRAIGALVPPLSIGGYLLALEVLGAGLAWGISIWLGVMITAGIIGLGLACLMAPPSTGAR